jgi:hypothetical protein
LTLGSITLSGANAGQFRKPAPKDLCSGATLAPTETCTVNVRFKPDTGGTFTATLVIPSDDFNEPSIERTLIGTGL